jgi:hemerythrin superfamily protein
MTDTASMDNAQDVARFLIGQHEQIKALFAQVEGASGDDRARAFAQLRRLLAVHETAEEEVVHPRARKEIAGGESVVEARLHEEHEAKETLAELEKLDVGSAEFATKFAQFRSDVVAHAEAEESQEFAQLAAELDDTQLQRMRNAVKLAESTAPTHPHAGVESAPANMLAGPFASMLDRARDMISRPKAG